MRNKYPILFFVVLLAFFIAPGLSLGADTDIYQVNVKQNAYILLDSSGSMDYGVYESSIDYGAMYDYLFVKDEIDDTIQAGSWFENHWPQNKIFLVKGKIRAQLIEVADGVKEVFTGDAANPDYLWDAGHMVDTHTYIDSQGNLSGEAGYTSVLQSMVMGMFCLMGAAFHWGKTFTERFDNAL